MFRARFYFVLVFFLPVLRAQAEAPNDFSHAIVPILKKHCVECHGGKEAKGGFSINTRQAFLDEELAIPKDAERSHFLELMLSTDPEIQMPPPAKPRVSSEEIAKLKEWVNSGMEWDGDFTFAPKTYEPPLKPYLVELPPAIDQRIHPIDRLIDHYLLERKLPRPAPIDDATFYRRASLDLVGLIPKTEELGKFIEHDAPEKRLLLVEKLLNERISYADHWLTFWNDLLRNDYTGTGFITGGRKQISGWLYESLLINKPYDQFARELIAPPTDESRGFIDGIKWRGEVSAGQTLEIQFAQSFSQSFLGLNMKCASCHDSFIDRWTLKEAYGLAAIYSQRELKIHRCDKPTGEIAAAAWLFPEIGQIDPNASQPERLEQLANLLTHPENGRFTRTIVNRLWSQMMGRGLVYPLDAMQSEPWHPDLLELLSNHLREHQYDLKAVLRFIASSQAYQSRSIVATQAKTDGEYVYRGPNAKRMTAEQFLDGVWSITQAGPSKIDAPVIRSIVSKDEASQFQLKGAWIWRSSDSGNNENEAAPPPAGEEILLRKIVDLPADVKSGIAAVTCDNEYVLFINDKEVSKDNNWETVKSLSLHQHLRKGHNEIVAIARNAGSSPNAAGFYFESRLTLVDGSAVTISSDQSWRWSEKLPQQQSKRLGKLTGEWKAATELQTLGAWKDRTESQFKLILSRLNGEAPPMVRASLLNSDFLMRSLGRPLREQIVSSRPSELTTLEAIDLTNGETLAKILQQGAVNILESLPTQSEELARQLFIAAYSRKPTTAELDVLLSSLDDEPTIEQIEDLLWVLVLSPEFMMIR